MADLRFTRIRYAHKDELPVKLEWQDASGADTIKTSLESKSEPDPEFIKTLRAFRSEALKLCELPREWGDEAEVRQVTISWKEDRRSIQIMLVRPLPDSNAPLVLTTPSLPETETGSGMSTAVLELLNKLEKLAEHYVAGERAQTELELEEDRPKKGRGRRREKQDDIEEEIEHAPAEVGG